MQCCGILPYTDTQPGMMIKNQGRKPYEIWFPEGKFKPQQLPESCCITAGNKNKEGQPGAIQQDQNRKGLTETCNTKRDIYQEVS